MLDSPRMPASMARGPGFGVRDVVESSNDVAEVRMHQAGFATRVGCRIG